MGGGMFERGVDPIGCPAHLGRAVLAD
ncbi:hypothetical protein H4W31_003867 [Plantactinospora soyae]|uniref:Uncharacterized protein n=1 Tax=Plantactinospora soyae TaxID=1544732 RepID=A0A927M591_9ACTN|nr:hypothetical protein [Plantactinospora soyae]